MVLIRQMDLKLHHTYHVNVVYTVSSETFFKLNFTVVDLALFKLCMWCIRTTELLKRNKVPGHLANQDTLLTRTPVYTPTLVVDIYIWTKIHTSVAFVI